MSNYIKENGIREEVDVCIIGAGHAGCEAALACARLGLETVMFTVSVDSIALMPCNPNIGGSSKGHLVRELDALGGEMGKNIDKTFIQSKMLNVSKGPAVHSLRAQADKSEYTKSMRRVLENQPHLTIKQAEVCELLWENSELSDNKKRIIGVKTFTGSVYLCKAVCLCTGTYLNARCLCGEAITYTGPNGLQAATHLSASLEEMGISLRRFKTGTPARMDGNSIDYSKMEEQFGDERIVPFSFSTNPEDIQREQVSCWLTYTNEKTHDIIKANLDRSPIYAGIIEGTGPRYCPSIEDKVVKFSEKDRHQVFLEPEGLYTNEMYVGGMSSSLPEDVQLAMYRTVPGLENCKIVRNAYAIEYDCINANQLYNTLEFKNVEGLFAGGQFNGSSGYEEAACQGFVAGVNASMKLLGKEPLVMDRSESYIGVLIDDLVTKDNREPYRMMTSRAEYRLLLRQDNADLRLRKKGYEIGLISQEDFLKLCIKEHLIQKEMERLKAVTVGGSQPVQAFLTKYESSTLKTAASLAELICRPELNYDAIKEIDFNRDEMIYQLLKDTYEEYQSKLFDFYAITTILKKAMDKKELPREVIEQVEIEIKYEGYIDRQRRQVVQYKKMEKKMIPANIDYDQVPSLRLEARQKLKQFLPVSVGQASRISGVTPADISVLLVYLEKEAILNGTMPAHSS